MLWKNRQVTLETSTIHNNNLAAHTQLIIQYTQSHKNNIETNTTYTTQLTFSQVRVLELRGAEEAHQHESEHLLGHLVALRRSALALEDCCVK